MILIEFFIIISILTGLFLTGIFLISKVNPNDNIPDKYDDYIKSRNRSDKVNKIIGYILFITSVFTLMFSYYLAKQGGAIEIGHAILFLVCGILTLMLAVLNFHPQRKKK